ncbi:uncharacterized protein LOC108823554 isoform X4 [Raphanus sativus]|uniref:Uncharacterized protein LOC108823554 isoform X4 n=1 Tax=Raphanus sativus TaxID=3726 RepID=A0A9W3CDE6_RAPSA|nr:uncharacterized protein LOC108823554 isoform X4 [Raphanus sativus]
MLSLILHGRKSLELQRCRTLRFAVNPLQDSSAFSSASAATLRKGHNFTVSTYLIESLGFTTKLAESISKKVTFEERANAQSVLSLLRRYKFRDSHISSIITNYPRLLTLDAERSLAPKLDFLKSRGASTSELTEILSKVPKILRIKKDKTLSRYYDFVREIVHSDKISSELLPPPHGPNRIRNVFALRQLGVPQDLLFPLLVSENGTANGKERFQESLKKVLELGFDPATSKFVQALRMLYQMSEKTIEEKVSVYKKLGLSVEDVWGMFKRWPTFMTNSEKKIAQTFETFGKCGLVEQEILSAFKKFPQCIGASEHDCNIADSVETFVALGFSRDESVLIVKRFPQCIGLSVEMVKKKTEFVVKEMNWPLKAVASYPQVFGLSMEKRIVPRCEVIKALMSKGLLGSELPSIGSALLCTNDTFLERYVTKYDDDQLVAELMGIFTRGHVSTK